MLYGGNAENCSGVTVLRGSNTKRTLMMLHPFARAYRRAGQGVLEGTTGHATPGRAGRQRLFSTASEKVLYCAYCITRMALNIPLKRNPEENDDELLLFPEAPHLAAIRSEGAPAEERWMEDHEDGRLAVDVLENDKELVITSAIAGVKPENLEVFVHNDMLTIRGKRHADTQVETGAKYLVRECHWGSFSRSVILP